MLTLRFVVSKKTIHNHLRRQDYKKRDNFVARQPIAIAAFGLDCTKDDSDRSDGHQCQTSSGGEHVAEPVSRRAR